VRTDINNLKDPSTTMTESHVAKANCIVPLTLAKLSTMCAKINAVNLIHLATQSTVERDRICVGRTPACTPLFCYQCNLGRHQRKVRALTASGTRRLTRGEHPSDKGADGRGGLEGLPPAPNPMCVYLTWKSPEEFFPCGVGTVGRGEYTLLLCSLLPYISMPCGAGLSHTSSE
jgi:hypothetical protein